MSSTTAPIIKEYPRENNNLITRDATIQKAIQEYNEWVASINLRKSKLLEELQALITSLNSLTSNYSECSGAQLAESREAKANLLSSLYASANKQSVLYFEQVNDMKTIIKPDIILYERGNVSVVDKDAKYLRISIRHGAARLSFVAAGNRNLYDIILGSTDVVVSEEVSFTIPQYITIPSRVQPNTPIFIMYTDIVESPLQITSSIIGCSINGVKHTLTRTEKVTLNTAHDVLIEVDENIMNDVIISYKVGSDELDYHIPATSTAPKTIFLAGVTREVLREIKLK